MFAAIPIGIAIFVLTHPRLNLYQSMYRWLDGFHYGKATLFFHIAKQFLLRVHDGHVFGLSRAALRVSLQQL